MSIRFKCPACSTALSANDDKAGKRTNCPRCNQEMRIPPPVRESQTPWAITDTDERVESHTYDPPQEQSQIESHLRPLLWSGFAVLVASIIGLVIILGAKVNANKMRSAQNKPNPVRYEPHKSTFEQQWEWIEPILVYIVWPLAIVVSYIFILIWVVKDCRNRSVDNGVLWMLVVMLTTYWD